MKINGEAIYGSRPFEVYGEDEACYTRNKGNVYATVLNWNGNSITFKALHKDGVTLGKVSKVELLGSDIDIKFVQDEKGLTMIPLGSVLPLPGITNQQLASECRVLRIIHDKGWINDDDPGVIAPGWFRYSNLNTGDFNNDLTISDTPGDVWSCSFTGNNVAIVAPKEAGAGRIEIQIDGENRAVVDLSTEGKRKNQQVVYEADELSSGNHTIKFVNCGPGPVAVNALIIR
jgi:alpha-L-fucosidase